VSSIIFFISKKRSFRLAQKKTKNQNVLLNQGRMTTGHWNDLQSNPHAQQSLAVNPHGPLFLPFVRTLGPDSSRERYRRRREEQKTVLHWGQRKLLLSEIEFLTLVGGPQHPVVYAGAAPGSHLPQLAKMFPEHTFYCYDPAPFNPRTLNITNLQTYQMLFTDEIALAYKDKNALFVCDIRTADCSIDDFNDVDESIETDMNDQQRWCALMQPVAALLKFRLSWKPGVTTYMNGQIFLPVFGPKTTTESRLLVIGKPLTANSTSPVPEEKEAFSLELRDYDNTEYEDQMFYFNTRQRSALYPHDVCGEGLDHCYDCRAEIHILSEYCLRVVGMHLETSEQQQKLNTCVGNLSRIVSRALGTRTLLDPNIDSVRKTQNVRARQWIDGKPAYQAPLKQRKKILDKQLRIDAPVQRMLCFQPKDGNDEVKITLTPIPNLSATTVDHPAVNEIRTALTRKTGHVFALPTDLPVIDRQKWTSTTGWARCTLQSQEVIYVHENRKVCTFEPPAIRGWMVRQNADRDTSNIPFFWEHALTGEVSTDVPNPLAQGKTS